MSRFSKRSAVPGSLVPLLLLLPPPLLELARRQVAACVSLAAAGCRVHVARERHCEHAVACAHESTERTDRVRCMMFAGTRTARIYGTMPSERALDCLLRALLHHDPFDTFWAPLMAPLLFTG